MFSRDHRLYSFLTNHIDRSPLNDELMSTITTSGIFLALRMSDQSVILGGLLRNALCLTLDQDLEISIEDQLCEILINYSSNEETFGKDYVPCDLRTYVDTELPTRFQLTNTDSNFNSGAENSWSELLEGHWNSAEYAVALQIIISLTDLSVWNKLKLGEIKGIKELLLRRIIDVGDTAINVQEKLADLYCVVASVNFTARDLLELYTHFPAGLTYRTLESLAAQMSDPSAQAFLQFENCYRIFKTSKRENSRFTLQFFIQFSNITSNRIMTVGKNLYLEIKEGQFCMSNDEFIIALFENLELQAEVLYSIAVSINENDISLYVDGNLIDSLTLFEGSITAINQFELGSMISSFKLYRFVIFNDILSEESIKLIHAMGSSFRNSLEETIDMHGIRLALGDKFLESFSTDSNYIDRLLENLRETIKKCIMVDLDPTYLCVAGNSLVRAHEELQDSSFTYMAMGKCFHYRPAPLVPIFQSINCFRYILCNLENSRDMDELFQYLSHLMTILRNNYMRALYRRDYGFPLLSHILVTRVRRKLKSSLPIQFFNLFQKFCGWNFSNISKSLIEDESAYQSLILNIDIWYTSSSEPHSGHGGVEIIRFLLFQIGSLIEASELCSLNSQKLRKLNVLKTFCNNQHIFAEQQGYPNVFDELSSDLSNVYNLLLKDELRRANIQWFLQFSYSELKSGFYQNSEVAFDAVDSLFTEVLDTTETNKIRCITDSVSCKFLLMALDETILGKRSPVTILNILLKVLLVNETAYKNFIRSNGLDLLFCMVKNADSCYYEDVVYLLYGYSLGDYNVELNLKQFENGVIHPNATVVMKELQLLSINLLEWAVVNDISNTFQMDLDYFITIFIKKLGSILARVSEETKLDSFMVSLYSALLDILTTLTKPQNSSIYEGSAGVIKKLLADNVTKALMSMGVWDFERYFEATISPPHGEMRSLAIGENEFDYFELAYLRSIIPAIFTDLEEMTEFFTERLFESDCMLFNFLHIFNRLKELLIVFKMEPSVYVNMLKCTLACIKSAKERHGCKKATMTSLVDAFAFTSLALLYPGLWKEGSLDRDSLQCCTTFFIDYGVEVLGNDFSHYSDDIARFMCWSLFQQIITEGANKTLADSVKMLLESKGDEFASQGLGENDLSNILTVIQVRSETDTESIQHYISALEKRLQVDAMSSSFSSIEFKERACMYSVDRLSKEVCAHRDLRMESKINELRKRNSLFRSDNAVLDRNLRISFKKHHTNFVTDKEEDYLLHGQQYLALVKQLRYTVGLQLGSSSDCAWGIDSVENFNGMKGRLAPFVEAGGICEIDTNSDQQKMGFDSRMSLETQPKTTNKSLLSYDLMSELDTLEVLTGDKEDENRKILKILKGNDSIRRIWNTSLVIGLDVREGVLIFGQDNLYFVSNYSFVKAENRVLKLSEVPLSDRDANISLITGSIGKPQANANSHDVQIWKLPELASVIKRPFLLRDAAMELMFENGTSFFLSFKNKSYRDDVYYVLDKLPKNENIDPVLYTTLQELNNSSGTIGLQNGIYKTTLKTKFVKAFATSLSITEGFSATTKWQKGELSNFYYLMTINTLAGRTFNDITQYPVFPWVIADYTSEDLDLDDPLTFRDLSKPMGAQSERRRAQFIERYEALESLGDPDSPPFHYGTHYSSAMIVSSYLIRLKPYVDSFLLLQDGKFGHADRLFSSIGRAWSSAAIENTTDVRELTPEFFFLPEFLVNLNNFDLGKDQQGNRVSDVILPPWAKNDPKIFIAKNREALESPYVSSQLHLWIDLIFGSKQRGENAISAINVFNNLSYPGAVYLDSISDENERRAVTGIIHNFGQTPLQIFQDDHPTRIVTKIKHINENIWQQLRQRPSHIYQPQKRDTHDIAVRYIFWEVYPDGTVCWKGYPFLDVTISSSSHLLPLRMKGQFSLQIGPETYDFLHCSRISSFSLWRQQEFVTGDINGIVKIWRYEGIRSNKSAQLSCLGTLYGHLSEVKDIKVYYDYNTLLSLDTDGTIYLWDLIDYKIVRRISSIASQAAISQNQGTIAVFTMDMMLMVYNFSGMLYISEPLNPDTTVTSIEFVNFSSVDLGSKRHAYWKEKEVIVVGCENGTLQIYELVLEQKWKLKYIRQLETGKCFAITAIRTQLRIHSSGDDDEIVKETPKLEIMAGDTHGFLYLWK